MYCLTTGFEPAPDDDEDGSLIFRISPFVERRIKIVNNEKKEE